MNWAARYALDSYSYRELFDLLPNTRPDDSRFAQISMYICNFYLALIPGTLNTEYQTSSHDFVGRPIQHFSSLVHVHTV